VFHLSQFYLGGENLPLRETSFEGITPRKKNISTPNVFLGTPFRSPSQSLESTPGRVMNSQFAGDKREQTPLRDQLSINPGTPMDSYGDGGVMKQQQMELRAHLKAGLGTLPAPRNDFEIVLPDNAMLGEDVANEGYVVEDASEVEERLALSRKAEGANFLLALVLMLNLLPCSRERVALPVSASTA
jgi:pre-mRNA-splicing factor CDC5/CEF1